MKNKIILLISPEAWGSNFVSKHHYAVNLAKNNTVYFLNPPTSYTKNPFGSVSCKTRVVRHGLVIVNYINLLPKLNSLPTLIRKNTYARQAKQIQEKLSVEKFDVVWSFDPNRFSDQSVWKADKRIYHSVDVHTSEIFELESALSSDLVIVVSKFLLPKFENINRKHFTIHGVDQQQITESINICGKNRIKIGFLGNFQSSNIDYKTLISIAKACESTADLILIGPASSNNLNPNRIEKIEPYLVQLENLSNVYFIGQINSEVLDLYLNKIDINLILYKDFKKNIFPHKLMKYIANEKIVLSTPIFDLDEFPKNFIEIIDSETIEKQLHHLIDNLTFYNSPELRAQRLAFAQKHSYDQKIMEITELLYE